jgi:hypothetical protein
MKLSKDFSWHRFQIAVQQRQSSFVTDGYKYDIIYVADGAMMTNKRPAKDEDKEIVIFYTDGMISRHPYNTATFLKIAQNQNIIKHVSIEDKKQ